MPQRSVPVQELQRYGTSLRSAASAHNSCGHTMQSFVQQANADVKTILCNVNAHMGMPWSVPMVLDTS